MGNGSWIRERTKDHRVYRAANRAQPTGPVQQHGPANFNLFYWLVQVIEDITGYAFGPTSAGWWEQVKAFIENTDTNIDHFPNVGLLFYVESIFVCRFPQNLNCSIGVGLEQSLIWVTVGFIALIIIGSFFIPLVTVPFAIIGYGISYISILFMVAFFFPPACWVLFPSLLGIGVAFPECLMDQLIAFFDKYITNCYVPLLIPACMVGGI